MHLVDFSRFDPKNQDLVKEVTALGLKYSLLTPYTSFVAVDQVKRADGQVVTVKQPLPLPEGVSDLAVGERNAEDGHDAVHDAGARGAIQIGGGG